MTVRGEPETRRQAADWLARLHADDRDAADEDGFRTWLRADPAHAAAFERASTLWDAAGGLRDRPIASRERAPTRRAVLAGGAALVVAGGVTLGLREARAGIYQTAVGEQRRLLLDDGTRVMLDTDTRIRYRAHRGVRSLTLTLGRIDLEIAPDSRPFVIDAGARHVSARGGRLDLRRDGDRVALTALAGGAQVQSGGRATSLGPGARLSAAGASERLDRPELGDVTAWQDGRLSFRDETLAAAASEMNRYSRRALVLTDARAGALRLSGLYRVGDPEAFARSLAVLLPVRVRADPDAVRISAL